MPIHRLKSLDFWHIDDSKIKQKLLWGQAANMPLDPTESAKTSFDEESYVVLKDIHSAFGIAKLKRSHSVCELKLVRGL